MNPVLISRSSLSPVFSRRALEKKVISSQFKAASLSTDAPVSSVSISVATDSKVAPLVAALFFRTTRNNAANYFPLVFEMRGNNLQSSSSREIISLKASFLKDDTSDVIDSLLFNLFNPSFYDFELIHAKETALQLSEKVDHAVDDALHRTAFRRGHLVNSPYLKEFSDVSIADFDALVNKYFILT